MAEPPMFQEDWVIQINKMLDNEDLNYPAILRVPMPLLDLKPAAYIPQFLSLGPYHHSKIEKDTKSSAGCKISRAEEYKGKTAAIVSQNLHRSGKNFKSIVEMMEQMRPDIERFYQWPASTDCEYSQNFNFMMAIDSSFLLHWLLAPCFTSGEDSLHISKDDIFGSGQSRVCTQCDIMKLENQIPLFVLRNVFEHLKQAGIFHESQHFNGEMWFMSDDLHPFVVYGKTEVNDALVEKEQHLMGFLHAIVSQFLQMRTSRDGNRSLLQMGTSGDGNRSLLQKLKGISVKLLIHLVITIFPDSTTSIEREFLTDFTTSFERRFLRAFTAEQLNQGGIKFKMLTSPGNILFDEDSSTLYLPCIHVSEMETEVFLRNMVALEFNDTTRPNSVTRYIALMASLVRSTDDVRLLKRRGIIHTNRLSDECVANMWSGICQPFFTGEMGYEAISIPLFRVLNDNYLRTKIKRMLLGLFDYVSSWKFIAPLAGFLGLALTAIQAYPVLFK